MRQARKEALLHSFPEVPARYMSRMKDGKRAGNFAVLLTNGNELFVRCFHRYSSGKNVLAERQRYVFAKDGSVRYGLSDTGAWKILKEFREPVFSQRVYGYTDNTYTVLNPEAIRKSCVKYCCYDKAPNLLFAYLHLYCKHPNVEYLMKSGYKHLITARCTGWYGGRNYLESSKLINWKSNNLLKMLGLNRDEFKLLTGKEEYYEAYIMWREVFPKVKPADLLMIAEEFGYERGTMQRFCAVTGLMPQRISRYLKEHNVLKYEYSDYLDQCERLHYDLHDTAISMPRDFKGIHTRLTAIVKYNATKEMQEQLTQRMAERKPLEFAYGGLFIRQPESMQEIIDEGKALYHCVGGYAERHAKGKLHIMFIRTADKPDVPFYTVEVSQIGEIVQVRGLRNCKTTPEVDAFIEEYKQHLAAVFGKEKRRKSA